MLISIPTNSEYAVINENDLIALTKDGKFIGYAIVSCKATTYMLLDVDKKIWKTFNELLGEDIPFDFSIEM